MLHTDDTDTRPAFSQINPPPQNSPCEFFIIQYYSTRILSKQIIYGKNIPGNLCTEPLPPICDSLQTEFNLLAKSSTSLHVKNRLWHLFQATALLHYA